MLIWAYGPSYRIHVCLLLCIILLIPGPISYWTVGDCYLPLMFLLLSEGKVKTDVSLDCFCDRSWLENVQLRL